MSKLNPIYENPIDNFIVFNICSPISSFIHSSGITPNMITTVSFLSGLTSLYFLYNYDINKFMLLYIFSYICDCLDGFIARKYNMSTVFGDYYDHYTDIIQYLLFLTIIFYKYDFVKKPYAILIYFFIGMMFLLTQGCQEILMKNNSSEIVGNTKILCFKHLLENISFYRIFGTSTVHLSSMILVYYLHSNLSK